MAIVRWDPFGDVLALRRGVNRMFEDMVSRVSGISGTRYPRIDLTETKDALELSAELPGVSKDDVKISLTQNVLSISGERKAPALPEDAYSLREERNFGTFDRSIELPVAVDTDKVKANFRDGMLVITLAKREEAKPREIQVEISDSIIPQGGA